MNLNVDECVPSDVSTDELRFQVNKAVGNIVNPIKMKEHLVNQLKTQVADLERFIEFLQNDVLECKSCACCQHHSTAKQKFTDSTGRELKDSINMVKRAASLLQMFALLQFGCGDIKTSSVPHHFRKNDLKNPMKVNHWGDVRARLQIAVSHILDLVEIDHEMSGDYRSDTDESPSVACNVKLTYAVRKHLAMSLRDLVQHGLTSNLEQQNSLVPFMGCFSRKSHYIEDSMHAWELIMMYYTIKNGEQYNTTPARKLSQSFNLDIVGGTVVSNKQSLLSTIGTILSTHSKYKRSNDSHFKAFVCAALNCNKLVTWLKLVFQCRQLIHMYYFPWSYAIQTGFQDALHCLDALTSIHFDLPVDLAVRQFQSIKDVFT